MSTTHMPRRPRYQNRIESLQGTLDMLILQTLVWGPQHGYGISQSIRGRSGKALQVETGSLYPGLHRLEKQGWVKSQWKQTRVAQTLVCMSAPQLYQCDPVEMLQTWHEESLYQMAEGRRHKGQCLRHPRSTEGSLLLSPVIL